MGRKLHFYGRSAPGFIGRELEMRRLADIFWVDGRRGVGSRMLTRGGVIVGHYRFHTRPCSSGGVTSRDFHYRVRRGI